MKHRRQRRSVASMRKPYKHPQGNYHKPLQELRADVDLAEETETLEETDG